MDLNSLRVFNVLHGLELSEQDFNDINEEQCKTDDYTGVFIQTIKRGYAIGVSHDTKHDIFVKRIDKAKPKSRILFKTIVPLADLPPEIYTLHQIAQYRSLDTEIKCEAKNLEELKDRICDRLADKYSKYLGGYYGRNVWDGDKMPEGEKIRQQLFQELIEKQLKAIAWLFGTDVPDVEAKSRKGIAHIVAVFQRNNRRVAIIRKNDERYSQGGGGMFGGKYESRHYIEDDMTIVAFKPTDERYDYVSKGREIYNDTIWLDDNLCGKLSFKELEVIQRHISDRRNNERAEYLILTADKYHKIQNSVRLELMNAQREAQEEQAERRLKDKLDDLYEKKGKVVRQGITYTHDSIEYMGVIIKGEKMSEFIVKQNVLHLQEPDFNGLWNSYITFLLKPETRYAYYSSDQRLEKWNFEGKTTIQADKVKVEVESKNKTLYVNDKRINKYDVNKVISKALSYDKQEDYDNYVGLSSRVPQKLQEALDVGGIAFAIEEQTCYNKKEDTDLPLIKGLKIVIPIEREDNKNYAVVKGERYKVKDINALFELGREINSNSIDRLGGHVQRTIRFMFKAFDGLTPQVVADIIEEGKKGYKDHLEKLRQQAAEAEQKKREATERSKEFLAHAVKITNAQKTKGGWLVDGQSGMTYFVSSGEAQTYTVIDGKQKDYICIMDKQQTDFINDKIAKRLLMLSKDIKVAREVHTLGHQIDTHWADLMAVGA